MSIRRDLLLRTALLRQPDMPPLPPLRAIAEATPPRRASKPATRRRPLRVLETSGAVR
jgi:hypothetical protein